MLQWFRQLFGANQKAFNIRFTGEQDWVLFEGLKRDTGSKDNGQVVRDALRWYKWMSDKIAAGHGVGSFDLQTRQILDTVELPSFRKGAGKITPFPKNRY